MYDTDTISAMASGLGEALADGVEPIYSESYGEPVTLELTEEQEKYLYENGRGLVRACIQKYGWWVDSEDLEQECMIEVARAIKRFDPSRVDVKLSTLVWVYVRNRVLMACRHIQTDKHKYQEDTLPEELLYSMPYYEAGYTEVERWDEREYYYAKLKKAMDKLPEKYRFVLQLTVSELSQDQIGLVIGKCQSQVSRLKRDGIKRIQKILAAEDENYKEEFFYGKDY